MASSVLLRMARRTGFGKLKGNQIRAHVEALKPKIKTTEPPIQKDKAFFAGAPEISIFVACCVLVNELRGLERGLQMGDISQTTFDEKSKNLLEKLGDAVEATHRFDIVMPVFEPGRFSPFFWRWFNWWDDYLKALTPSGVAEAERRARERGSLIDDLRPKQHWVIYRNTPAICVELCLRAESLKERSEQRPG